MQMLFNVGCFNELFFHDGCFNVFLFNCVLCLIERLTLLNEYNFRNNRLTSATQRLHWWKMTCVLNLFRIYLDVCVRVCLCVYVCACVRACFHFQFLLIIFRRDEHTKKHTRTHTRTHTHQNTNAVTHKNAYITH